MLNLASNLERKRRPVPGQVVVHAGAHSLSYAQLDAASNQLANGLRALGIQPGDKSR
jgi:long-chain acyl-CoA synthetase